ncbi:MAG: hypothetical protein ACO1Q7_11100 [Gemmatimonas sp.]
MSSHLSNVRWLTHRLSLSAGRSALRAVCIATGMSVLAGCSADAIDAPLPKSTESSVIEQLIDASQTSLAANAGPSALVFSTYDGSGQVVHPDVVSFDQPWNGHRLWNALTPYPNSATQFENPSLFASEDGDHWQIPEGVANPLTRTNRGYLSDPDMLFDEQSGEMWLYYREVQNVRLMNGKIKHLADHVWRTTSTDAVNWSAPRRVTSDTGRFVVSPSIVRKPEGGFSMYQVEANGDGCSSKVNRMVRRQSTDGLVWTKAVPVTLTQTGFVPWHMDVQYIPSRGEYWALIAAYAPARGCMTTSLFLATSTDGATWKTYATPVLAPGEFAQFGAAVYRSTFAYQPATDSLTVWYSGARMVRAGKKGSPAVFAWSAAVSHSTGAALLARVNDKNRTLKLNVASAPGEVIMSGASVP